MFAISRTLPSYHGSLGVPLTAGRSSRAAVTLVALAIVAGCGAGHDQIQVDAPPRPAGPIGPARQATAGVDTTVAAPTDSTRYITRTTYQQGEIVVDPPGTMQPHLSEDEANKVASLDPTYSAPAESRSTGFGLLTCTTCAAPTKAAYTRQPVWVVAVQGLMIQPNAAPGATSAPVRSTAVIVIDDATGHYLFTAEHARAA